MLSPRPWQLLGAGLCLGAEAGRWVVGGSLLQPLGLGKTRLGPALLPHWGEPGRAGATPACVCVQRAGAPSATPCPKGVIACVRFNSHVSGYKAAINRRVVKPRNVH